MLYASTRGCSREVGSAEAIKMGIAEDGGLFVPNRIPELTPEEMGELVDKRYNERAFSILSLFLEDIPEDVLRGCIDQAYNTRNFDTEAMAPVVSIDPKISILELWHGPTCAFKDMALQILPRFMVAAMRETGEDKEIVILVATSGDTGKAALEGFRDVPGTKIMVFYPAGGVSRVQELQMVTQEGGNVGVTAVKGNFDDTQTGVKSIFGDKGFNDELENRGKRLSSANSINWGRLVPQIVYYFSGYLDLVRSSKIGMGEKINIVVPTGNFGNILAAYYAGRMGLPINKLICASNINKVLSDFIRTGVYDRRRDFHRTISPSMDILISSNLERLLFELTMRDSGRIRGWMRDLAESGVYSVDGEVLRSLQDLFWGGYADDADTLATIKDVYEKYGYIADTHTAVGLNVYSQYVNETGDRRQVLIASTASPFKFSGSVVEALFGRSVSGSMDELSLLEYLSEKTGLSIPEGLRGLDKRQILHKKGCDPDGMKDAVRSFVFGG